MATEGTFAEGDEVVARTRSGWTDAKIVKDNDDGTYNIIFVHGTSGKDWKKANIRGASEAARLSTPVVKAPADLTQVSSPKAAPRKSEFRRLASAASDDAMSPQERRLQSVLRALGAQSEGATTVIDGGAVAATLVDSGLLENDPRVTEVYKRLRNEDGSYIKEMTEEQVREMMLLAPTLLFNAFTGKLAVPDFAGFCDIVKKVYDIVNKPELNTGANADYIPQLNEDNVDPNQFGISICTVDGQRFNIGHTDRDFCVQSTSKPLSYLIADMIYGPEYVHHHVGCEPSGVAFNEMVLKKLPPVPGKVKAGHGGGSERRIPHNPMINAGAIMACSMVYPEEETEEARVEKALLVWQRLCGGHMPHINKEVYLSEAATADRNWCLAYMMKERNSFPVEPPTADNPYGGGKPFTWEIRDTLNFYFQQCSIEIPNDRSAVVAATLANGGLNPLTNDRIFNPTSTQHALSLMQCCGMYDYSGTWAYNVGVPSKSGVGGSVIIAIPNVCGISIWSPRLDDNGNSVRGVLVAETLGTMMKFHPFDMTVNKVDITEPKDRAKHNKLQNVMFAASSNDIQFLRSEQAKGGNIFVADYDKRTALHIAAAEGFPEIVQFLIDQKGNVNAEDRWGGTPLNDAKAYNNGLGQGDVIKMLESAGGTLGKDHKTKWQYSKTGEDSSVVAILYAAADNDTKTLVQLSAQGANLFLPDYDLRTSLHLAASNGREDALRYLLRQFPDKKAALSSEKFEDRWGTTPRQDAVRENHQGCVDIWDQFVN